MTIPIVLQPTNTNGKTPSPPAVSEGLSGELMPLPCTPNAMKLYHPPNPIPYPKLLAQLSKDLVFRFLCNRSRWHSDPPAGVASLPQLGSWGCTHPIQQSGDWRRQCRAGLIGLLVLHPPLPLASVSKARCWASIPSVRLSKDKWGRAS